MEKKDNKVLKVAVGLSAAAAAIGAYFMYGSKNAAKNRKAVKSWVFKAKAEVLEALENTQEMTKTEYNKLVDSIGAAYANVKDATKADLAEFKREMKSHWEDIAKTSVASQKAVKKAGTTAKKAVKKTAKKTVKKVKKVADKALD